MFKKLLLLVCLMSTTQLHAQNIVDNPTEIDLSVGLANEQMLFAGSFNSYKGVLFNGKLKLGLGVRINYAQGSNQNFSTAPFKLISEDRIDEITGVDYNTLTTNLLIHIVFMPVNSLSLGFNIDAVGLSFGNVSDVNVSLYESNTSIGSTAQPTTLNLLLIGDNDIGTLNSEFYAKYYFSDKLAARAGFSMLFTELSTDIKMSDDNTRFRNKSGYLFAALSIKLF